MLLFVMWSSSCFPCHFCCFTFVLLLFYLPVLFIMFFWFFFLVFFSLLYFIVLHQGEIFNMLLYICDHQSLPFNPINHVKKYNYHAITATTVPENTKWVIRHGKSKDIKIEKAQKHRETRTSWVNTCLCEGSYIFWHD